MPRMRKGLDPQAPGRILVLAPCEPEESPWLGKVIAACASVGPTHVIAFSEGDRRQHEYDGHLHLERIDRGYLDTDEYRRQPRNLHPFEKAHRIHRILKPITDSGGLRRLVYRYARARRAQLAPVDPAAHGSRAQRRARFFEAVLDYYEDRPAFDHGLALLRSEIAVAESLYARARALSVVPRVIVCHETPALLPAVRLQHEWSIPVLFAAQEDWPEARSGECAWLVELKWHLEHPLVRRADRVVAASTAVARRLEGSHGLRGVGATTDLGPWVGEWFEQGEVRA